jgi:hypothetical protein
MGPRWKGGGWRLEAKDYGAKLNGRGVREEERGLRWKAKYLIHPSVFNLKSHE